MVAFSPSSGWLTGWQLLRAYEFTIVDPFNTIKVRSNSVVVQEDMFLRAWPRKLD